MWESRFPQEFFLSCRNIQIRVFRAEIFKSGYFVQKYWSGTVTRYALPSHARLTIWIGPNQTRLSQKILDSDFQTSPENGTKSMHYIIRGKFVISPCRKKIALFWIRAVILLFRAEILPCGPPLLPHSCAEPFLGVVQKYSFLGDIYTSALVNSNIKGLGLWT